MLINKLQVKIPTVIPETQQLEEAIARRARRSALDLPDSGITGLAIHARQVLKSNERCHLTTITEPEEFIERHFGESFEGATLVDPAARGVMFDLGSGNGFPGLPFHVARPELDPVLAEVSKRKAAFLTASCLGAGFNRVQVLQRQIQRPSDLPDGMRPNFLLTRAMGGWEKVLPRFARELGSQDRVLLWAGDEMETISRRKIWQRFKILQKHPLPGLDRGWIWVLGNAEVV